MPTRAELHQERLRTKIKKIKATLAAERQRYGGFYDDSRGLRFMPPRLYIQLGEYSSGLRYMSWFNKNFPDDFGFPEFLLDWTILLFKAGKVKDAETKAFKTFCRNTYVLRKVLGQETPIIPKYEFSTIETAEYAAHVAGEFKPQGELDDFMDWLRTLIESDPFKERSEAFIQLQKQLLVTTDSATRQALRNQADQLFPDS